MYKMVQLAPSDFLLWLLAADRVLSDASPARFSRHRRSDSNERHLAIDLTIALSWEVPARAARFFLMHVVN